MGALDTRVRFGRLKKPPSGLLQDGEERDMTNDSLAITALEDWSKMRPDIIMVSLTHSARHLSSVLHFQPQPASRHATCSTRRPILRSNEQTIETAQSSRVAIRSSKETSQIAK